MFSLTFEDDVFLLVLAAKDYSTRLSKQSNL